jgi:acetyl-CoA synthetase
MVNKITSLAEYLQKYQESVANPDAFWGKIAESHFWRKKWDQVLDYSFEGENAPDINWFKNGKLNITENIFERNMHMRKDQVAIIWEPNDPKEAEIRLTYGELFEKVKVFANGLLKLGVKRGDRVAIYLPMVPELAIAMLACARIGAIHSIVFAGFSATALADRVNDAESNVIITSDGGYRGTKSIPLKAIVDDAVEKCPTVKNVIVLERTGQDIKWFDGRDIWWHDVIDGLSTEIQLRKWMQKMYFLYYILRAQQENPKVWCIPPVDTWFMQNTHLKMYFNTAMEMCTGVLPISDG